MIFVSDKPKQKMSLRAKVDQKTNESKLVHLMHFKCELCKKKYATEASVIKLIEKCHEHINPTNAQEYYSSFVVNNGSGLLQG